MTLQELSKQALLVQDASNLCGVAQTFARVLIALGAHCSDTFQRNKHPIAHVWAHKIADLAGVSGTLDMKAYEQVCRWAEGLDGAV